ncbi:MAG: NAD(P)-dependent alcohol dehydrogenase [Acinetobacter sp.]|jgi:NADPH:quinone reductase-like Zn-dependent oxidoreductase|nr:MAG: NAD(P)-dependent alcohol dehydrogenase [Acinetobacter sp.]
MKAVVIDAYRSLDAIHIKEIPKPQPKSKEVLVRVMAASVNSGDERLRDLNFKGIPIPGWLIRPITKIVIGFRKPRKTLGITMSGVVESVGDQVSNFKVGDEVFVMTGSRLGAFAEYAVALADHCIAKKPANATFAQAAALPFGGTTAMYFLRKAGIENAKRVLICGATGAVGVAAVQIAKHFGVKVSAVCGTDGIELSKKLGASKVYDYATTELKDIDEKFDIVFDTVGHSPKRQCVSLMNEGAKYVSTIGTDTAKELSNDLEFLSKLYESGELIEVIDSTYVLKDARKAFERVASGRKKGSVILNIGSGQ